MEHLFNQIKIIIIIAALLSCNLIFAQDDEFENYAFDDNETQKSPYFALSFGGNTHFLFMNYDEINKKLGIREVSNKLNFSGPIFGWGFNFFSAMSPLVNNARIGINYFSGNQVKEFNNYLPMMDTGGSIYNVNENYYRKLSVSHTGIHFDYAVVPTKSLAILPGLGLKMGSMVLEEYKTLFVDGTPKEWNKQGLINTISLNEKIEYSYIALEPQLNIEYAITGFLMLRAAGSYVLSFENPFYNNAWTINGNNSLSGVPKSVKPQGFSASVGLYLGLFNY